VLIDNSPTKEKKTPQKTAYCWKKEEDEERRKKNEG
jgi:hypothetical protein